MEGTTLHFFMLGNLEPEERVLEDTWQWHLLEALDTLEMKDGDLEVVIGGSQIYEIEGDGTRWKPEKGTRKYNKDAFIVIRRKQPVVSSVPPEDK